MGLICSLNSRIQGYSYYGEVKLGHWVILGPFGLGNRLHVPHVLGNGSPVLGNGPHLCTTIHE